MRTRIAPAVVLIASLLMTTPVGAREAQGPTILPPGRGGFTQSLGLPPVYKGFLGVELLGYALEEEADPGFLATFGVFKDLGSPVVGAAGVGLQGYAGTRRDLFDSGARALFTIPSFRLHLGLDYNIREENPAFMLGIGAPIRRGGVFGNGSNVMLRWLPARGQTVTLGVDWPLWGSNRGRTRPRRDDVELDRRDPARLPEEIVVADLAVVLAEVRDRATWIARLSQPFVEVTGADPVRGAAPGVTAVQARKRGGANGQGGTLNEEIRLYHAAIDRAFAQAIGDTPAQPGLARQTATLARRILLEEVLAPYNANLGQRKEKDDLSGFIARAQSRFLRQSLSGVTELRGDRVWRTVWVFQTLGDIVEANRIELRRRWEDSRFVWLPLQYALAAEDHDTQDELNAIIELCTNERFSRGNRVSYELNEEFQFELARSIRLAEDYHVLWIHDFRGVNALQEPDAIAYMQVVSYLQALTERVRAYDRTGTLPVYMLFLDQHYFEINQSRLWLPLLREPLARTVDLPPSRREWAAHLAALQDSLREAVAQSRFLQLEASQYGLDWLENRIRVHVSITNPADNSFVSFQVAGIVPIPDNMMRDHRKIAFYDVGEEDPYRGLAIFTGMGVGEHYVGPSWEDRAMVVSGPEALDVKEAAYQLLTIQGLTPDEIPHPLRPRPRGADYEARVQEELAQVPVEIRGEAGLLQLHNETGYTPKPVNVAKAVLYSLMPAGSSIRVPDALWQSYLYASLLAGSALRGCRIALIAPTLESAPSAAAVTMARSHGLLARVIAFENGVGDLIRAEGGFLHVGVYAPRAGVRDLAARFEQALEPREPWTGDGHEPDSAALTDAVAGVRAQLDSLGYRARYLADGDSLIRPKLHLKANLFVSREAWHRIYSRPEWAPVFRAYMSYLAENSPDSLGSLLLARPSDSSRLEKEVMNLLTQAYGGAIPQERERMMAFMTVGSANMNYRSMVMDGEVMLTLAGPSAVNGMLDFLLLDGLCEWPRTPADLDRVLPPPGGVMRTLSGLLKLSL